MGGGVDNGTLLVGFPVVVMITKAENVMSVGMEVLTDMVLLLALSDPWSTDPVVDKLEACEPVGELDPFGFEGSVVVKDGERVERAADSAALVEVVLLRCEDDIVEDCG